MNFDGCFAGLDLARDLLVAPARHDQSLSSARAVSTHRGAGAAPPAPLRLHGSSGLGRWQPVPHPTGPAHERAWSGIQWRPPSLRALTSGCPRALLEKLQGWRYVARSARAGNQAHFVQAIARRAPGMREYSVVLPARISGPSRTQ